MNVEQAATMVMVWYLGLSMLAAGGVGAVIGYGLGRRSVWAQFEEWKHQNRRIQDYLDTRRADKENV